MSLTRSNEIELSIPCLEELLAKSTIPEFLKHMEYVFGECLADSFTLTLGNMKMIVRKREGKHTLS
jgi:hypothetical protein